MGPAATTASIVSGVAVGAGTEPVDPLPVPLLGEAPDDSPALGDPAEDCDASDDSEDELFDGAELGVELPQADSTSAPPSRQTIAVALRPRRMV